MKGCEFLVCFRPVLCSCKHQKPLHQQEKYLLISKVTSQCEACCLQLYKGSLCHVLHGNDLTSWMELLNQLWMQSDSHRTNMTHLRTFPTFLFNNWFLQSQKSRTEGRTKSSSASSAQCSHTPLLHCRSTFETRAPKQFHLLWCCPSSHTVITSSNRYGHALLTTIPLRIITN